MSNFWRQVEVVEQLLHAVVEEIASEEKPILEFDEKGL